MPHEYAFNSTSGVISNGGFSCGSTVVLLPAFSWAICEMASQVLRIKVKNSDAPTIVLFSVKVKDHQISKVLFRSDWLVVVTAPPWELAWLIVVQFGTRSNDFLTSVAQD